MDELYCNKLKAKIKVTLRKKTIFSYRVQNENVLNDFEYLQLSVIEIDGQKPTLDQIVDFFIETVWDLSSGLKSSNPCVLQLYGELLPNELPQYYPFIFTSNENNRYYLPEVANSSKEKGYLYSWITFEHDEKNLEELKIKYRSILNGFIVEKEDENYFQVFYRQDWSEKIIFEDLLQKSIIYFNLDYDFDFMDILTRLPIEETVQRLKNGLLRYDNRKS